MIPTHFAELISRGDETPLQEGISQEIETAFQLEEIFAPWEEGIWTHHPEELYAAEDDADWDNWCQFCSSTRELDGRRKGLVEIVL